MFQASPDCSTFVKTEIFIKMKYNLGKLLASPSKKLCQEGTMGSFKADKEDIARPSYTAVLKSER